MNKTRQFKGRHEAYELQYWDGAVSVLLLSAPPLVLGYAQTDRDGDYVVRTYSDYVLCDDVIAAAVEFLHECEREETATYTCSVELHFSLQASGTVWVSAGDCLVGRMFRAGEYDTVLGALPGVVEAARKWAGWVQ